MKLDELSRKIGNIETKTDMTLEAVKLQGLKIDNVQIQIASLTESDKEQGKNISELFKQFNLKNNGHSRGIIDYLNKAFWGDK